jgi:hypothetical protein
MGLASPGCTAGGYRRGRRGAGGRGAARAPRSRRVAWRRTERHQRRGREAGSREAAPAGRGFVDLDVSGATRFHEHAAREHFRGSHAPVPIEIHVLARLGRIRRPQRDFASMRRCRAPAAPPPTRAQARARGRRPALVRVPAPPNVKSGWPGTRVRAGAVPPVRSTPSRSEDFRSTPVADLRVCCEMVAFHRPQPDFPLDAPLTFAGGGAARRGGAGAGPAQPRTRRRRSWAGSSPGPPGCRSVRCARAGSSAATCPSTRRSTPAEPACTSTAPGANRRARLAGRHAARRPAAGGPLLVAGGRPVYDRAGDPDGFSAGARQFDSDITHGRHPRAALGLAPGRLLAVVCDGSSRHDAGSRSPGSRSPGSLRCWRRSVPRRHSTWTAAARRRWSREGGCETARGGTSRRPSPAAAPSPPRSPSCHADDNQARGTAPHSVRSSAWFPLDRTR